MIFAAIVKFVKFFREILPIKIVKFGESELFIHFVLYFMGLLALILLMTGIVNSDI